MFFLAFEKNGLCQMRWLMKKNTCTIYGKCRSHNIDEVCSTLIKERCQKKMEQSIRKRRLNRVVLHLQKGFDTAYSDRSAGQHAFVTLWILVALNDSLATVPFKVMSNRLHFCKLAVILKFRFYLGIYAMRLVNLNSNYRTSEIG